MWDLSCSHVNVGQNLAPGANLCASVSSACRIVIIAVFTLGAYEGRMGKCMCTLLSIQHTFNSC